MPIYLANPRESGEQDAARFQNTMQGSDRCAHIVDQVERLREDNAIESI